MGILQSRAYDNQIKDVEELRQRVKEEWDSIDQRVIDSAVTEWRDCEHAIHLMKDISNVPSGEQLH